MRVKGDHALARQRAGTRMGPGFEGGREVAVLDGVRPLAGRRIARVAIRVIGAVRPPQLGV
jgi:hypothetical protein